MKRTTVVLTDEQEARLEAEAERSGTPADVVIGRALDMYLGIASNGDQASLGTASETAEGPSVPNESPFRSLIAIGRSEFTDTAARIEEILAEEWGGWLLTGDDPPFKRRVGSTSPEADATDPKSTG
jgi:hypothetical protein